LLKTDIRNRLEATLTSSENIVKISEFYPKEQVEYIRDLMLSRVEVD
jgi:hypothetical protein